MDLAFSMDEMYGFEEQDVAKVKLPARRQWVYHSWDLLHTLYKSIEVDLMVL